MSLSFRSSAAAILLAALLPSAPVHAELVPVKTKQVLLASSSEEVVAGGAKDLFREQVALTGSSACAVVRFSGELLGTNKFPDFRVVASFDVLLNGESITPTLFQEAPVQGLTQLVSFSTFACGLPAEPSELVVTVRGENGDEVTVRARTLEVWTGRRRVPPDTIGLVRAP